MSLPCINPEIDTQMLVKIELENEEGGGLARLRG
jgi:hypothetical protein